MREGAFRCYGHVGGEAVTMLIFEMYNGVCVGNIGLVLCSKIINLTVFPNTENTSVRRISQSRLTTLRILQSFVPNASTAAKESILIIKIYFFSSLADLKMSSADQSEGLMFEMNAAKEKKTSLKVETPGDEKMTTLKIPDSHLP